MEQSLHMDGSVVYLVVSNILTLVMAPEEMSVDHQSQSESSSGVQKYRFASVLTDQWLFCDQVQLEW